MYSESYVKYIVKYILMYEKYSKNTFCNEVEVFLYFLQLPAIYNVRSCE